MERPLQANKFMLLFMIYMALMPAALQLFVSFVLPFEIDFDLYRKYMVLFGHVLIFGIPILFLCFAKKIRPGDLIPHERLSPLTVVLVIFIAVFTMPLIGAMGIITQLFADSSAYREADEFISQYSFGYMITAVGIMPAVFEELMFRGVIMTGYKRAGIVKAVFFSALYFGIMHMSLYQLIYATVAGFVFGVMVHYSNSIFSSMLAHFIVNGTQVTAGFVVDMMEQTGAYAADTSEAAVTVQDFSAAEIAGSVAALLVISVPVIIGLLYAFIQVNKGKETDYKYSLTDKHEFEAELVPDREKDRAVDAFFVFVLIFYIGYLILDAVLT